MPAIHSKLRTFLRHESGATAIEYGLIAAMIAVGIIATLTIFGENLAGLFNNVANRSQDAMS